MHLLLALALAGGPVPAAAALGPAATVSPNSTSTNSTSTSTNSPAPTTADPCKGALDAGVVDGVRCQSPVHADVVVAADAKAPAPPLVRDPSIFPGELGFVATVLGLAGGAAVVVAVARDDGRLDADASVVNDGVFYGGVSVIGLAGLVAGAAVSTWVFDPATAQLKLPIFDNEPR